MIYYEERPEVEDRVDKVLEDIVADEENVKWKQTLSIGFKRNTNGNAGINADFIEIGDSLKENTKGLLQMKRLFSRDNGL